MGNLKETWHGLQVCEYYIFADGIIFRTGNLLMNGIVEIEVGIGSLDIFDLEDISASRISPITNAFILTFIKYLAIYTH